MTGHQNLLIFLTRYTSFLNSSFSRSSHLMILITGVVEWGRIRYGLFKLTPARSSLNISSRVVPQGDLGSRGIYSRHTITAKDFVTGLD